MNEILKADKIPYFLTLIFIVISVQFNYTVEKIFKTPIIEYKFEDGSNLKIDSLHQHYLMIKNISSDELVEDLHIQLNYIGDSKSIIKCPDIDAIPPASLIQSDPKYTQDKLVYYHIPIIQPGLSYRLIYFTNTPDSDPIISFECKKPLKLMRGSFYSLILQNSIFINVAIMLVLLMSSIIYITKLKKA